MDTYSEDDVHRQLSFGEKLLDGEDRRQDWALFGEGGIRHFVLLVLRTDMARAKHRIATLSSDTPRP